MTTGSSLEDRLRSLLTGWGVTVGGGSTASANRGRWSINVARCNNPKFEVCLIYTVSLRGSALPVEVIRVPNNFDTFTIHRLSGDNLAFLIKTCQDEMRAWAGSGHLSWDLDLGAEGLRQVMKAINHGLSTFQLPDGFDEEFIKDVCDDHDLVAEVLCHLPGPGVRTQPCLVPRQSRLRDQEWSRTNHALREGDKRVQQAQKVIDALAAKPDLLKTVLMMARKQFGEIVWLWEKTSMDRYDETAVTRWWRYTFHSETLKAEVYDDNTWCVFPNTDDEIKGEATNAKEAMQMADDILLDAGCDLIDKPGGHPTL